MIIMDIDNKASFILGLVIHDISIITILFPSAIVHYPFHQTPIFMYLHYFGALILLSAGIYYSIGSIKENKKIITARYPIPNIICNRANKPPIFNNFL